MLAMRLMGRAQMLTESIMKVSCRQLRTARVLNKRWMRFYLRLESASLTRSRWCLGESSSACKFKVTRTQKTIHTISEEYVRKRKFVHAPLENISRTGQCQPCYSNGETVCYNKGYTRYDNNWYVQKSTYKLVIYGCKAYVLNGIDSALRTFVR